MTGCCEGGKGLITCLFILFQMFIRNLSKEVEQLVGQLNPGVKTSSINLKVII